MIRSNKYLRVLGLPELFPTDRRKTRITQNPTVMPVREEAREIKISVYDYDATSINEKELVDIEQCFILKDNNRVSWINIDGLRRNEIERISGHFGIHPLLAEDILSINQRPKMDDVDGILFCLLNMLYYNEANCSVEIEQISIVLGQDYVISFQEDANRDVFNPIRDKLKINNSKIRQRGADYLCYTLLDMIVDNYFLVMEKLGDRIETLEEEVIKSHNQRTLVKISQLRKELIVLKRNIAPVRELINGFLRSESDLLEERNTKYFKDIYDHIVQAADVSENYRDMMMSLQDLYLNNVNLKMNEVMKVMAIVTCLLAPATVIGGIFGMNFDVIPFAHDQLGFYMTVTAMLLIPLIMLTIFKKRGWF